MLKFASLHKRLAAHRSYASLSGQMTTLANGVKVYSERTGSPHVRLGLSVSGGTFYEQTESAAAMWRSCVFAGTGKRDGKALQEALQGGLWQAEHSRDFLTLHAAIPRDSVDGAVGLMSEMMTQPSFANAEAASRALAARAAHAEHAEPAQLAQDFAIGAAFQGHGAGHALWGPGCSENEARAHVQRVMRGPGTVLTAVGDVDHAALCRSAEAALRALPAEPLGTAPAVFSGADGRLRDDTCHSVHAALLFEGCPISHDDYLALLAFVALPAWRANSLEGDTNGNVMLAETAQEAIGQSYQMVPATFGGVANFLVAFSADGEFIEDFTYNVQNDFIRRAVNGTDLEMARQKLALIRRLRSMTNPEAAVIFHSNVSRLANALGRVPSYAEIEARIEALTANDIRRAGYDYFVDVEVGVGAVGPLALMPDYNQIRGWTYWNRL